MLKSSLKDALLSALVYTLVALTLVLFVGSHTLDICAMLSVEPASLWGGVVCLSVVAVVWGCYKFKKD